VDNVRGSPPGRAFRSRFGGSRKRRVRFLPFRLALFRLALFRLASSLSGRPAPFRKPMFKVYVRYFLGIPPVVWLCGDAVRRLFRYWNFAFQFFFSSFSVRIFPSFSFKFSVRLFFIT
jgi:hypothetical protein